MEESCESSDNEDKQNTNIIYNEYKYGDKINIEEDIYVE